MQLMQLNVSSFYSKLNDWLRYIVIAIILFCGLFFQSKYPFWFQLLVPAMLAIYLLLNAIVDKPSKIKIVFVFVCILVALFQPVLFSIMKINSLASGFVLIGGILFVLFISKKQSRFVFWLLVPYLVADTLVSSYLIFFDGNSRPMGMFNDFNIKALIYLIVTLFLFSEISKTTIIKKNQKCIYWFLLALLSFGFHLAQSRYMTAVALLGFLILALATVRNSRNLKLQLLYIIGVFVISYFASISLNILSVENFQVRGTADLSHLNGRINIWRASWDLLLEAPVFGHGLGLFSYLYEPLRTEYISAGIFAHNDYLEYWVTSGFLGFIFVFIPVILFIQMMFNALKNNNFNGVIFSGIGLCIMAFSLMNFFFWRFENFLILAATWKLAESGDEAVEKNQVKKLHKFIFIGIALAPLMAFLAKADEGKYIATSEIDETVLTSWSDFILAEESMLLPIQVRYLINTMEREQRSLNLEENQALAMTRYLLNEAVDNDTPIAPLYCARAEVSYLYGEKIENAVEFIEQGLKINPANYYCHLAEFSTHLFYGKTEVALEKLYQHYNNEYVDIRDAPHSIELIRAGILAAENLNLTKDVSRLERIERFLLAKMGSFNNQMPYDYLGK